MLPTDKFNFKFKFIQFSNCINTTDLGKKMKCNCQIEISNRTVKSNLSYLTVKFRYHIE